MFRSTCFRQANQLVTGKRLLGPQVGISAAHARAYHQNASWIQQQRISGYRHQSGHENGNRQQDAHGFNYAKFLMFPTLAFTTSYIYLQKQNSDCAMAAAPQNNIDNKRGVQENKIRFFGNPQQIFKHFSANNKDGSMSY